jgi:hypothetical protein
MLAEVRVLVDACRDSRVRDLHQEGAPTTQEREDVLSVEPADDGILREEFHTHAAHLTE